MAVLLQTSLHAWHASRGGRLVEFAGWSMPVQYTTIVEEHQAVRRRVGLFDISHMGRLRFVGAEDDVLAWLESVTTNRVAALAVGQIQYSLMLLPDGGVLDDVLVYRLAEGYRMVCNASNRPAVLAQLETHRGGRDVSVQDQTQETVMIAVQGPEAVGLSASLVQAETPLPAVRYYHATPGRLDDGTPVLASRTGYTGEDGYELIVPAEAGTRLWETLLARGRDLGIRPCGLGARDTLRFEAGMPLHGHEIGPDINPYAGGVGWAVKLDKGEFVGRDAAVGARADPGLKRVGLELAGKRIARQGADVLTAGRKVGVVTSGTFSPTLEKSLAMALVEPAAARLGTELTIDVRGKGETARTIPLPFYKRPKTDSPGA